MSVDPRRVEELFDAAVDLDPAEAALLLDEACAGDPALRAAVEGLLGHDREAAGDFLAPNPGAMAQALREAREGTTTVPDDTDAGPVHDPARLGRFFVLRRLGEGGMGVVYVGYDEVLDRRVALKLLRRGRAAPASLLREAQALARLAHPNVVAVHEVGEHDGRVFLAMELVDGQSLRAWLADGPRSIGEILGVLLQAGRGLAAAHEAGLVHRDFKPENVLVGKDGRVRVVDFGIAALAASDVAPVSRPQGTPSPSALERPVTRTGALVGTPAFMAPERFRGERATSESDQFAFAVTLYRAVYGEAPFPGDDVEALVQSVLAGAARPPPRRPGVPTWLGPIVRRGLSADPAARFPSMTALLAAIDANLPRTPDLDPLAVRRERLQLMGLVSFVVLGFGAVMATSDRDRVFWRPFVQVEAAIVAILAVGAGIFVLRRRLLRNLYGRRLAAIFIAPCFAWLAHRLIAVRLGTPPMHVFTVDLVIFGAIYGTAAMTFERWMGWIAIVALAGAAASAYARHLAPTAMIVVPLAATVIALLRWRRDG